jgi:hypothetical protein
MNATLVPFENRSDALELFEKRRDDLLNTLRTDSGHLAAFTERVDAAANHFRSLGQFSDAGYDIVVSLDFCELFDVAGANPNISRKRILADIGFSRAAMRALRSSRLQFTILPGTIAEILLYLSLTHARNVGFIDALKRVPDLKALAKRPVAEIVDAIGITANDLVAFNRRLVMADHLMRTVEDLVSHPNFISTADLGLRKTLIDQNVYEPILNELRNMRGDVVAANNVVDALNLAVADALSSHDEPRKRVVVHMTRTPSLHKLGKKGIVVDMSVSYKGAAGLLPILCRPDAMWLFAQIMPDGRDYSLVEEVFLAWIAIGSKLRLFEMSRNPEDQIRKLEEASLELDKLSAHPRIGKVFEEYMQLYVESAVRAEQFSDDISLDLIDREEQSAEMDALSIASSAVLLQEKIRHVFGILRSISNVGKVLIASGAAASEIEGARSVPEAYPFLRDSGLTPSMRVENGVTDIIIHHPATEFVTSPVVLIGCQLYGEETRAGCTVYWPTNCKLRRFLRAVGKIEPDTKFFVMLGFEDDKIDYVEGLGGELAEDPRSLWARASDRFIRVIQMCGPSYTYTCELPLAEGNAYTSVTTIGATPDGVVAPLYESTGNLIPPSVVRRFVDESWRAFSRGNDQRRSPESNN